MLLEVAQSLEAGAFIQAYGAFTSHIISIFSVNGTILPGAERELRAGIRSWNRK